MINKLVAKRRVLRFHFLCFLTLFIYNDFKSIFRVLILLLRYFKEFRLSMWKMKWELRIFSLHSTCLIHFLFWLLSMILRISLMKGSAKIDTTIHEEETWLWFACWLFVQMPLIMLERRVIVD